MCQREKEKEIWDSVQRSSRRQCEEWKPGDVFTLEFLHKSFEMLELCNLQRKSCSKRMKSIQCPLKKEIGNCKKLKGFENTSDT